LTHGYNDEHNDGDYDDFDKKRQDEKRGYRGGFRRAHERVLSRQFSGHAACGD
jgi:hypothetical protein